MAVLLLLSEHSFLSYTVQIATQIPADRARNILRQILHTIYSVLVHAQIHRFPRPSHQSRPRRPDLAMIRKRGIGATADGVSGSQRAAQEAELPEGSITH